MKNNSKEVELTFELQGFSKQDIKVRLRRKALGIKAEKKSEKQVKRRDFFYREKSYRGFSYTTTLPAINPKKARTELKDGVLRIKPLRVQQ